MRLNTLDTPCLVRELDKKFENYSGPLEYVIDVGAHVGIFSCLAAERGAKLVLAVEPNPTNFQVLLENIAGNNFQNIIVPLPFAVTNQNWQTQCIRSGSNSCLHSLVFKSDYPTTSITSVWSISLWMLIASLPRVDFLKMDIEGGEWDLLSHPLASEFFNCVYHIDIERHIHDFIEIEDFHSKYNTSQVLINKLFDLVNEGKAIGAGGMYESVWTGNLKSKFERSLPT